MILQVCSSLSESDISGRLGLKTSILLNFCLDSSGFLIFFLEFCSETQDILVYYQVLNPRQTERFLVIGKKEETEA